MPSAGQDDDTASPRGLEVDESAFTTAWPVVQSDEYRDRPSLVVEANPSQRENSAREDIVQMARACSRVAVAARSPDERVDF
jgi:hypothetical protein